MKIRTRLFLFAIAGISLWGCEKEGPAGKNSLINQVPEPAGANCATGGLKIISGVDSNSNNVLDNNEIQKTDYVCNGSNGNGGNSIYNKETIIYFPGIGYDYNTLGNTSFIDPAVALNNFDITNYPADSISFSVFLYGKTPTNRAYAELYDVTNNKVINNTTVSTINATTYVLQTTTVNFLKDMPKGPITLNCRVRTEQAGGYQLDAYMYNPFIRIYKK